MKDFKSLCSLTLKAPPWNTKLYVFDMVHKQNLKKTIKIKFLRNNKQKQTKNSKKIKSNFHQNQFFRIFISFHFFFFFMLLLLT